MKNAATSAIVLFAFAVSPFFTGRASSQTAASTSSVPPTSTSETPIPPAISWDVARQDRRITALAQDGRGRIFVASEESGVWMCGTAKHSEKAWRHFNSKNCSIADDNIYALTVDKQDRVWAGTAGHGVSIFNGRSWKNYGVLKAPIGERIFDIAVCPTDGDVWIASNVGLTRHSVSRDTWTTRYPAPRLPFNHIAAIAFTAQGDIVLGTQTDGVLLADAKSKANPNIEYSKWRRAGLKGTASDIASNWAPIGYAGEGLPSNMVNDVLVSKSGTIYVATTSGLAWSKDGGQSWRYTRGADYSDKISGRYNLPQPNPAPAAQPPTWSEDYISCLAEDGAGMLWIGHWRRGYEVLDPKSLDVPYLTQAQHIVFDGSPDDKTSDPNSKGDGAGDGAYVKCILPLDGQAPLIGRYGFGLTVAPRSFETASDEASITVQAKGTVRKANTTKVNTSSTRLAPVSTSTASTPAAFPAMTQAPTLAELNALLKQLSTIPVSEKKDAPQVVSLDDDWSTRGDWLGRYGRYWANLCAINSPEDYIWGAGYRNIRYISRIGPNADKRDSIRYWVSELYNNNPNTLEIPPAYFDAYLQNKMTSPESNRRQAEVDDHGEEYPYVKDGPHLYVSLQVPTGLFTLSLYNWNKDGDTGQNRRRDYRISVRPHNPNKPLDDISDFVQQPELANARIRDFRRGVWKRFLVRGPQELTVEVNKNYGLNTILAGVMLDEVKEQPAPYFRTVEEDRLLDASLQNKIAVRLAETPTQRAKRFAAASNEIEAANRLANELEALSISNPLWHAQNSRKFYLPLTLWYSQAQKNARSMPATAEETQTITTRLGSCFYQMRLFDEWEKCQRKTGLSPARDVEKAIKWDGITIGSGKGYEAVSEHLLLARQQQEVTTASTQQRKKSLQKLP